MRRGPLPGREPFGDVVRLECLDAESCVELATLPMAALNVHYANADLVELIASMLKISQTLTVLLALTGFVVRESTQPASGRHETKRCATDP